MGMVALPALELRSGYAPAFRRLFSMFLLVFLITDVDVS